MIRKWSMILIQNSASDPVIQEERCNGKYLMYNPRSCLCTIRKGSTPQRLLAFSVKSQPLPSIDIIRLCRIFDFVQCRRSILCLQQIVCYCYRLSNTLHSRVLNFDRELDMSHGQFYVVDSRKVQYNSDRDALISAYDYQTSHVDRCPDGRLRVTPITKTLTFRTSCRVPRVGCMLVGWGGNNGSTVTATVLANKLKIKWRTKDGIKVNYAVIVV